MSTGIIESLIVITPAYEEWENLHGLAPEVVAVMKATGSACRWLVVCEPFPPAGTSKSLLGLSESILVIPRDPQRESFADALQIGINQIHPDDQIVVFMDGDNSHDPKQIRLMVDILKNDPTIDVVISSRYVSGGRSDNSLLLKLMSRSLNVVYRLVFRIPARDVSTNFKAFRAHLLVGLELQSKNFEAVEEILLASQLAKGTKLRIVEIPDHFRNRKHGVSKRKLAEFVGSYFISLWRMRRMLRSRAAVEENNLAE